MLVTWTASRPLDCLWPAAELRRRTGVPSSFPEATFGTFERDISTILETVHLTRYRGTDRTTPPRVDQCIFADMERGDGFIMLASAFHGGGSNVTEDEYRLAFATFITRGFLRQEENQFLAVPQDVARSYDRDIQEYIGYYMSDPACGYYEQMDPIYHLRPELLKDARPTDF